MPFDDSFDHSDNAAGDRGQVYCTLANSHSALHAIAAEELPAVADASLNALQHCYTIHRNV
jgi:hypothetical protein